MNTSINNFALKLEFVFFLFGWGFLMNTGPSTCCEESLDDGWLFGLVNRSLSVVGQCSQLAQRSLRTQEVQNKSSLFFPLFNSVKENFFFSFFCCYKYEILFYFYTLSVVTQHLTFRLGVLSFVSLIKSCKVERRKSL
jgi:hypothetical protein